MANPTFVFNSVNDDEFYDTVGRSFTSAQENKTSTLYEAYISNKLNASAQEFEYNFDPEDPVQSSSCVYLTVNQYKQYVMNSDDDNLLLAHLNIRSISRNFDKLRLFLENSGNNCSVIGLTETWLTPNISHLFSISGFDFVYRNRKERMGGGVGLYIPNKFEYSIHEELNVMTDVVESLFVEMVNPNGKNILIGVVYRPPGSNPNDFLLYVQNLMQNSIFTNKHVYLMGDFNIDLMKCNSQHISQEFVETLMSVSLLPLISKPTRVTDRSATLIDNIFCNILPIPESGIVLSDISDHYPIFTQVPIKLSPRQNNYQRRRKITANNLINLQNSLKDIDWFFVYNNTDLDLCYDYFIKTITSKIDEHIPFCTRKSSYKRTPRLPWITQSLLRSINRKNNLFYKYRSNPTDKNRQKYVTYKNTLTNLLRLQKRKFYVNQIMKYKNDIKNTWKTIKDVMNTSNDVSSISEVRWGNTSSNVPAGMAEIFNDFFASIGKNLSQSIPSSNKVFFDFLDIPNPKTIFLDPTYNEEVIDIIYNLKEGKSPGCDGIDNYLLKNIILEIIDPLVYIINLSLSTGLVPSQMKTAKVIPIYKKGEKNDVNNYRPISLLTSISKILERIVYIRTVKFFNMSNIFTNFQFGFRENHNTTHALLTFVEKITHALDTFSHTIGIFLDFSKAFDTINHGILLSKLSHYGIRGKALQWFTSYLSDRFQYVHVNSFDSSMKKIECGVPQGSLLGPLLFIVYINDFYRSSDKLSFILFADDSNLFYSHPDPNTLISTVNDELKNVSQWIYANKLSLNIEKTKYMFFSNSLDRLPGNVIFDTTPLEEVSSIKFLGVCVDNKLSWKCHINNICKVIARNIGIMNRLKYYLPSSALITLYSSLVLPYLNYGILAWGNTYSTLLDKLFLLQKMALRIVFNLHIRAHTDKLFLEHKILKIKELYLFQLGQFMFNYNCNHLPKIFYSLFHRNSHVHNYPTRQSKEFHLPLVRTVHTQNTFVYTGPRFWNSLDNDLKESVKLITFKYKLKKYLFSKYTS